MLCQRERLQRGDLRIQRGEILLDHVCQLGDLDGAVIEESFPFRHCLSRSDYCAKSPFGDSKLTLGQSMQLGCCRSNTSSNICRLARKLRSPPSQRVSRRRPVGLPPLGICQQCLALRSHFRGAQALLGLAQNGTEFARAILYRRAGHCVGKRG